MSVRVRRCPCRSTRRPPPTSHPTALTPGDGEDPLDRGRVRRVLLGQPPPERAPSRRGGRVGQSAGIGRVELGGRGVGQIRLGPEQVGLAGQDRDDVALGDVVQERQQLVPDPVPPEGERRVGRVVDRCQPQLPAQRHRLGVAEVEQRTAIAAHARQPVQACPPQEVEEHGLGLIVGRVTGEDVGGQRGVARGAGPGLEVRACLHIDALGVERRPEAGRRRQPPAPPRPMSRVSARGRRAPRSSGSRPRWPRRAGRVSRHRQRPRTSPGCRAVGTGSEGADQSAARPRAPRFRPPCRPSRPGPASAEDRGSPRAREVAPVPPSRRRWPEGRRPARCGR